MKYWNKLKRPPEGALKKITGGRLSGFTDIKPQWRYEVMTEVFGPCGVGWKYTIEELWQSEGADGVIVANAKIHLFIKDGEWSDPIPGVGGAMLVAKETKGLYTSDEAYKMAVTDALGTAMKYIGVAADVYSGLWDGSKYITPSTPKVSITNDQKNAFHEQVSLAIENGDDQELQKLWSEWGTDEKAVLWGLFNSQQRKTMKELMK